ncbi:unnamed protein product, partial [Didymodactylos carnosus]
ILPHPVKFLPDGDGVSIAVSVTEASDVVEEEEVLPDLVVMSAKYLSSRVTPSNISKNLGKWMNNNNTTTFPTVSNVDQIHQPLSQIVADIPGKPKGEPLMSLR